MGFIYLLQPTLPLVRSADHTPRHSIDETVESSLPVFDCLWSNLFLWPDLWLIQLRVSSPPPPNVTGLAFWKLSNLIGRSIYVQGLSGSEGIINFALAFNCVVSSRDCNGHVAKAHFV